MRVGLGLDETGKAVAGIAADAVAVLSAMLVEHDPDRQRERSMAGTREIVSELLDARLVRDGRKGVGLVAGRLGRIAAAQPVHMVEPLGLAVVRRKIPVGERPGQRNAVLVPHRCEILLAQPQQYRPIHLGIAADPVMNAGTERAALLVAPGLARLVAFLAEHRLGIPILPLA